MNIVEESIYDKVRSEIITAAASKKAHFGVMFCINTKSMYKAGTTGSAKADSLQEDKIMKDYEVINIIVNKGYAEDAMAAARKAGAGGGTIIGARGTAREGDATFFGVDIVPEKEMLMILVPAEKKPQVVAAIKELACFQKAGSGIIFCNTANDFTLLGK
jgi:nitrogen regulatory protein PII